MLAIALLSLIAWGVLAFGAVYPWAYQPLLLGCAGVGLAGLLRRPRLSRNERALAAALAGVVAAIAIQLLPLPVTSVAAISPRTDEFLALRQLGYRTVIDRHALSVNPERTQLALWAAASLACLLLGLIRNLSHNRATLIVRGICLLAAIVAVVGIAHKTLWHDRIYGFWTPLDWTPRSGGTPFSPFVNRNHFAGWMLMALPVALGYLISRLTRATRHLPRDWRSRVVWLSTPGAGEIILVASAVFLMAASLIFTASRSGLLGLAAALAMATWFVRSVHRARTQTTAVQVFLVALPLVALSMIGSGRITARFAGPETGVGMDGRLAIWSDTVSIIRAFPLTGTGMNTFGTAAVLYQTAPLGDTHMMEAHNDYLQLLAEGGVLVTVPAAVAFGVCVRLVRRRFRQTRPGSTDYWLRAGAVIGLLAIALQELVEFSLQMPGNAVMFTVLLALAMRPVEPRYQVPDPDRDTVRTSAP